MLGGRGRDRGAGGAAAGADAVGAASGRSMPLRSACSSPFWLSLRTTIDTRRLRGSSGASGRRSCVAAKPRTLCTWPPVEPRPPPSRGGRRWRGRPTAPSSSSCWPAAYGRLSVWPSTTTSLRSVPSSRPMTLEDAARSRRAAAALPLSKKLDPSRSISSMRRPSAVTGELDLIAQLGEPADLGQAVRGCARPRLRSCCRSTLQRRRIGHRQRFGARGRRRRRSCRRPSCRSTARSRRRRGRGSSRPPTS